jgi:hypothetical protein
MAVEPSDASNTFTAMRLPVPSPATAGAVFLRPEQHDGHFLAERAQRTGVAGLILRPRQLVILEIDGEERRARLHRLHGLLAKPSTVWFLDPETSALAAPSILIEDGAARLRATAVAQSVRLPLDDDSLADSAVQQELLEATWALHAGAAALTAPYLRIANGDDAGLALNLDLLARTAVVDGRPTMAVLEVPVGALTSGWLTGVGDKLRAAGADVVLVRIAGCRENASPRHAAAYLRLARELRGTSLQVICDQVGRLGPLLAAGAGVAFSTGSWHYRSVSRDLLPRSGGGGSQRIPYELPGRWRAAEPALARNLASARCPAPSCRALEPDATPADQREHFLHSIVAFARMLVDADLDVLIDTLIRSGDPVAAKWASAVRELQAESA